MVVIFVFRAFPPTLWNDFLLHVPYKNYLMKNYAIKVIASFLISSVVLCSCGPNDDQGGMDQHNSAKEGAIDSSRLPHIDTTMSPSDSGGRME